jgi:hypothetical protein
MKALLFCITILLCFALPRTQAQVADPDERPVIVEKDPVDNRDKAEKNTRRFDPGYFVNPENRHILLRLEVGPNQQLSVAGAQIQQGNAPYRPAEAGNLSVRLRNANGELLGGFSIEDPTSARSCEPETERTTAVPTGSTFELALPYAPDATILELAGPKGEQELDISAAIKRAISDQ